MDQSLPGLSILTSKHELCGGSCATEFIQTQNVDLVQMIPSVIDQNWWNEIHYRQSKFSTGNQNQIKT